MTHTQLALIPEEPYAPPPELKLLIELLSQVTSISVVSDFLRSKNLVFSAGSWEELVEKRLKPALQKHEITLEELKALLSESEEFGRAHTFLYTCTKTDAAKIIDEATVRATAAKLALGDCIGPGKVLDQPEAPTITSIRFEEDTRGKSLVIKIVEKRTRHKFIGERVVGKKLLAEWEISEARAVNVVRVFSFGLVEVRIASHQTSTRYEEDQKRALRIAKPFMGTTALSDASLGKAKIALLNDKAHRAFVRFSNSTVRNATGSTLNATSRNDECDLFGDSALSASLGAFWKAGDAYCESSNLYFLPGKGHLPSKEIHVLLPELRSEFAVPANCSKADYEYVLNYLRKISS